MKKFFIYIIASMPWVCSAQLVPQFMLPIWFEDAVGNKDTLYIGADTNSNYHSINSQYGERLITAPFDSIFEVRAAHGDDSEWKMSKVIVEDAEVGQFQCVSQAGTKLIIHAKNLPVKISWDTNMLKLNYPCNRNAILSTNNGIYVLPNWFLGGGIHCMMNKTEILEDFNYAPRNYSFFRPTYFEYAVEGQGIKSLPVFQYSGFGAGDECSTILLSSDDRNVEEWGGKIYPNPTSQRVYIESQDQHELVGVQTFDVSGRRQEAQYTRENQSVDFGYLPPGVYILQMLFENNKMKNTKVVKL